jgi:hypothetical protein
MTARKPGWCGSAALGSRLLPPALISACFHACQEKRTATSSSGPAAAAEAKADEGFFKAYLETILGNLQLSITNVHVRFEGELPAAGAGGAAARFAAGITLQELSAITTDASGSEAFEAKVRYGLRVHLQLHTLLSLPCFGRGWPRDCTRARH